MEKLISQLVEDCKSKGITTEEGVKDNIFNIVWPNYEGRATRERVQSVCDDLAESVCLKLGINQ